MELNLNYTFEMINTLPNEPMNYLIRNIEFKGKHDKIRRYLGTTELSGKAPFKHIIENAYTLEIEAAEKMAEMVCDYYTEEYLPVSIIKELEKVRFLMKSYLNSLNKIELEVYMKHSNSNYIHGTTFIEGNTLTKAETYNLINEDIVPAKSLEDINEI